jgi:RNA polymerase sigma-70 factor, ECF subfamily
MRHPTEEAIIEGLKRGDEAIVAELVEAYGPQVFKLALRQLRNREDAEEVTQDVLLKVVDRIADFRGDAALSSWIYRIAFNASMSRLRALSSARRKTVPTPAVAADWSSLGDEHVLRAEMLTALTAALDAMPSIYRVPVILRDVQGLTAGEASAVLRVKDQTLKSRLHRGRVLLRERLAAFAGGLTLRPLRTA